MRVLQIGADRSKRGILFPDSPAWKRQEAYAACFGALDIIGFSLKADGATQQSAGPLAVYPTNSFSKLRWGLDACKIARRLPKPDVVSAQDPFETGLAALLIARRWGVPFHVQVHTDFLSPEYARLSFLNRLRVWIAEFVLRRAVRVRVVSERIKTSISSEYALKSPISTLPIFVSPPASSPMESDFKTTLLWVGRLEKEKNPELAIRALDAVRKAGHVDVGLRIVGFGSEEGTLRRLVERLDLTHWVRFYPESSNIGPYFSGSDLVLVTSTYEGYGMVIIEARRAGKSVLSTDVGIAGEAGAIIAAPSEFADALKNWLRNRPPDTELKGYQYKDFDEYVRAYCDDIRACASGQ